MKVYVAIPAIFLIGVFGFACYSNYSAKNLDFDFKKVVIGNVGLRVMWADSEKERVTGLSGRESLGEDEGMFFVFEKEGYYGIWMKEMKFPLDIAWLDANKKIIHLEKSILPDTYPKVFNSNSKAQFVLEVNAGFFEKNKIKVGDSLKTKAY